VSRRVLLLALLAALPLACNRAGPPVVVTGPQSAPGWEVRYNASIALARRGSESIIQDRVKDTLLEMLDEEQQMRNFRHTTKDGKDVSDAGEAQLTMITAMQALAEAHRRKPELDLSPFKPAMDKLAASRSLAVSMEAKKAQQAIYK
jgi:hypothetical protein